MNFKKILIVLIVSLVLSTNYYVNAETINQIPINGNYLDETNLKLENDLVSTITDFAVIPNSIYTFIIPKSYYDLFYDEDVVGVYLGKGYSYDEENIYRFDLYNEYLFLEDFVYDEASNQYYCSFVNSVAASYMEFSFRNINSYYETNGINNFYLIEGSFRTTIDEDPTYLDVIPSSVLETSYDIILYTDQFITTQTILNGLTAIDAVDGDLTSEIYIKEDTYTNNKETTGEYAIVFGVKDTEMNETDIRYNIFVGDRIAPVINPIEPVVIPFGTTTTVEEVQLKLTASDNVDGDITSSIYLVTDNYTSSDGAVGEYTMVFGVDDSNGNSTEYTVIIQVVDSEAPIISGATSFQFSYLNPKSIIYIKAQLTVKDNVDSVISITTLSDNYSEHRYEVGTYQIIFQAVDSSGNTTTYPVDITIVDDVSPIIYFDSSVIQTDISTVLSIEDIINVINLSGEFGMISKSQVDVLYDSYSNHATEIGAYQIKLGISYGDGGYEEKVIQINVDEDISAEDGIGEETTDSSNIVSYIIYGSISVVIILINIIWYTKFRRR